MTTRAYVRVKPDAVREDLFLCGFLFLKTSWKPVDVDDATLLRLRTDFTLEVSLTDPGSGVGDGAVLPGFKMLAHALVDSVTNRVKALMYGQRDVLADLGVVRSEVNQVTGGLSISAAGEPLRGLRSSFRGSRESVFSQLQTVSGAGYTITNQWQARGPFEGVQLVYKNYAGAFSVGKAGVMAVSADLADGTEGGNIACSSSGSASLSVPGSSGSGNNIVPGIAAYEVVGITSKNALNLIQTRSYSVGATPLTYLPAGDLLAYCTKTGRKMASVATSGDLVGTWSAVAPVRDSSQQWISPQEIRFLGGGIKRFTVAVVGDSRARGQGSSGNASNAVQLACNSLTSATQIIDCENYAISGQNHWASMATARAILSSNFLPDAMVLHAWSPNDAASSQSLMDYMWANLLDVIDLCIQKRVTPIISTSSPVVGSSAPDIARVLAQNARVRSLKQLIVLDEDAAVRDTVTNVTALQYRADDTHYNDAGNSVILPYASASVQLALTR